MFVAGFIGSPAMSLIPLEASTAAGSPVLTQRRGLEPGAVAAQRPQGRRSATSKKIVLGARHSTIKLHKSAVPGAIPAKAYTVEPTGDVTFVAGSTVRRDRQTSACRRASPVAPDEPIWLEFDQDRMQPVRRAQPKMALNAD